MGSIPGSGRFLGEGNGNPLQYSCLGSPKDSGAWRAIVHGVTRVRHDLITKPPPSQCFSRSCCNNICQISFQTLIMSLPCIKKKKTKTPCTTHHRSFNFSNKSVHHFHSTHIFFPCEVPFTFYFPAKKIRFLFCS